jgi:Bacterial PH domain
MVKVPSDVRDQLGPNERVELYFKQKIFHPAINIQGVALTNERIILRQPHYPSTAKDYPAFHYTDFDNVTIHKGVLRSTLIFSPKPGTKGQALKELPKLPNKRAKAASGIIQENILRYQTPFAGISSLPPVPCKKCGANNIGNAKHCTACGARL